MHLWPKKIENMTNNIKKWPIKIKELPTKILFILQQFWIAVNNQNLAEILKQKWLSIVC